MDQLIKTQILGQYLRRAALGIPGCVYESEDYNFRCNVCGDGKKYGNKRGHLRLVRDHGTQYWIYKCFNEPDCAASGEGRAWSGEKWLQQYFPQIYSEYVSELLSGTKKDYSAEIEELENKMKVDIRETKIKKQLREDIAIKFFIPITDNHELCKKAIKICQDRYIPEEIYSKFFVATPGEGSVYSNRMIIPFYNAEGEIYYWQARSINPHHDPKYLNRLTSKSESVYNIYNIDKTKPVFITEGPIDSMFIENSISTLGLSVSEKMQEIIDTFDNAIYLFDGDKPGRRTAKKFLEKGKKVFLWNKFLDDMDLPHAGKWDINEIMLKFKLKGTILKYKDLENYISKGYFDLMWLN